MDWLVKQSSRYTNCGCFIVDVLDIVDSHSEYNIRLFPLTQLAGLTTNYLHRTFLGRGFPGRLPCGYCLIWALCWLPDGVEAGLSVTGSNYCRKDGK